jgi:hypothetical protein
MMWCRSTKQRRAAQRRHDATKGYYRRVNKTYGKPWKLIVNDVYVPLILTAETMEKIYRLSSKQMVSDV